MLADTGKDGQNATNPREGVFLRMKRDDFSPGILVTLGLIAAIETLASTAFQIPNAGVVLLLAVVYAAYSGGIGAGLVSAALALIYVTWTWSLPGAPFHYSPFNFNRVMVLLIVVPAMALMVGTLRRRSRLYEETAIANATLQAQIAERKETHDALQESRERLRRSQAHADIGTWDWNIRTGDLYWSERIGPLFGYAEGELETTYENFLNAVHPEDRQFVVDSVDACVNDGASYDIEHRIVWPDGTVRWVHERGDVVRADDGTSLRMLGVVQDVTERRQMEDALRESETRFRQLAENIREVFWVRDVVGDRILYVSPAYEQIWGRKLVSFDEAYRSFQESIHPDDRTRLFASMERETQEKTERANEYRIVRPDGAVRWVRSRAFPVRDNLGNTYRVVGVAEDITDLKHAEDERLAHALKQRDTLVREVHHRVKNNLQTVVGLLMHETYDHPELQPLLLKAVAQVQLIAVAHGIQGAAKAQEIPLCEMVPAIARIVESLTQSRIQIDVNIDMTRPAQICEKESVPIALILNELLFNATKHSPRDAQPGKIKVTICRDGNNVEVRIFNPGSLPPGFNFAARIATGTGLGLVGSLMPRQGATILFRGLSDGVETALKLSPPVIDV